MQTARRGKPPSSSGRAGTPPGRGSNRSRRLIDMSKTGARTAALADVIHRLAAVMCLASAYQFAATGFTDPRWVAAVVLSALVLATAPPAWLAPDPIIVPHIGWPPARRIATHFAPGWFLMLVAAAAKLLGL